MLVTVVACGRKQKTVRNFDTKKSAAYNRMLLFAPTGVKVEVRNDNKNLVWRGIEPRALLPSFRLIGYQIYSLSFFGIISRQPIALVDTRVCCWQIPTTRHEGERYLVRALFDACGEEVAGPLSAVAVKQK